MKVFSNEIVFRGHPDKVCDQISDALLDAYLEKDKASRCGIEVMGGKGKVFVTGEVTSNGIVNVDDVVKRVLNDIGYSVDVEVVNNLGHQSSDIALGTNDEVGGAGDNGMMFGYACRDTDEFLPLAMVILQKLSVAYDELRKNDKRFLPDGKAQITGYYENNKLVKIKDFVVCYQNTEVERDKTDNIIIDICKDICNLYDISVEQFLINPTGKFLIGGFEGDAGLTGRKIVVDSYHGFAPVGGGAFSGKDPTKVDRSGAYKAREIAKNILNNNDNLDYVLVQISYAIGLSKPLAIYITSNIGDLEVCDGLYDECCVSNIINDLNLLNINYEEKAKFGHFIS